MTTIAKHRQGGTGSSNRIITDKLKEIVSAKDFGAVGDGTTDDTAAIQAAANSLSTTKGAVYLPVGKYKVTTTITMPRGVSMFGAGGLASVIEAYNCDGITIQLTTWDQSIAFFEDFGISSMAGDNYTGFLSFPSATPGVTQDGLYLNRLKFFDWNIGIFFGATYQSVIQNCTMDRINTAIYIDGDTELINIRDNQLVCTGGGRGTAPKLGIFVGAPSEEAILIKDNFIYGFEVCIDTHDALFCIIEGNTFLAISGVAGATIYCIKTSGTKDRINIHGNLIEGVCTIADQAFRGVWLQPLNETTNAVSSVMHNRFFASGATGSSTGILVNSLSLTNQFNVVVEENDFIGFTVHDIAAYNLKNTSISQNVCRSTGTATHSIRVEGSMTGPVFLEKNWCQKTIYTEAAALTDGVITLEENVESATFQTLHRSAAPADGTWRVGDIVYNKAPATAGYVGWVCTVAGTPGTWKPFGLIA